MKVKLTYIAVQRQKNLHFSDPNYFQIFFTDDNKLPSTYILMRDTHETLKEMLEKYFYTEFDWMSTKVMDFRRINQDECEVVYASYMPCIGNANKSGKFISDKELEDNNITIDPYYEELLSRRSRGF
tara:strand:- start:1933 stop:2313 length:381 start_codon:yes stop_codon:yes gene_type:complete